MNAGNVETASPKKGLANWIGRAWAVVRADWTAYVGLNIFYYGVVVLGMLYVAFINPELQETLLESVGESFASGILAPVSSAYTNGQVIMASLLTFVVNLFLGTFIEITIPSMVIPFSGLLMGAIRAILWGLLLSPSNPQLTGPMIPHSLVLLLEGQGYILAMLAVYIHGKAFLFPKSYGIEGHRRGYVEGLRRTAWIYVLITLVLAAAAVYEAFEVIFIAPLLA